MVAILRALVEERTGLHYGPDETPVLIERVRVRAAEAGFESLLDYYYFLRYDPAATAEIEQLVEALVVNESYFFREADPLRVVCDVFLAPAVAAGRRPRVWSAACSTGEEPLTLAMLLADKGMLGAVDIVASDVSGRALDRARAGRFGRRSVREHVQALVPSRWLRAETNGEWTVAGPLREAIDWRKVNLTDRAAVAAIGTCDVILCRNVLIYFSDTTVARVVDALTEQLRPGGALFVGVSESLLRYGTSLVCEEHAGVFCYRRVA